MLRSGALLGVLALAGVSVLADLGYQGLGSMLTGDVYTPAGDAPAVDPIGTTGSTTTPTPRPASGSTRHRTASNNGAPCGTIGANPPH